MRVEPFDLLSASAVDTRARHDLFASIKRELDPGDPVAPVEHLRSLHAHLPFFERRLEWVVRDGDRMVGWGSLELRDTTANRELADFRIEVAPGTRRRGVGSALLDAITAAAVADGRTILGCTTMDGTPAEPFLTARGSERRSDFRISRLDVAAVDRSMLDGWVARAGERAHGYSLVGWDDPCPPELLERFAEVVLVMNTAPLDDLEREDDAWTPAEIADWHACMAARGHDNWVLCARDDTTGRFVGYTELGFWPWAPRHGSQGDTGVHPEHRNRGLGRWLKAAMLLRVLAERPDVRFIDTGNASSNQPMLSINVAMGFRPHRHGAFWQLKL